MIKNNRIKVLTGVLCAALLVLGVVSGASALPVNITLATPVVASGFDPGMPAIEAIINAAVPGVTGNELYRVTPGTPNTEAFALAGSYETTFLPDPATKLNALITYVGGPIIAAPAYLLAKDGSVGGWFFYNLTGLGWAGTENITLTGLFPNGGSFSHISMYGTTGTSVPEPLTILLLGLGFVGVAGVSRFRK
jgi:hypothetical protein